MSQIGAKPVIITCNVVFTSAHRSRRIKPACLVPSQRPCNSSRNAAARCFRSRPCSGFYLIGITLFGLRFRKSRGAAAADRSLKSYFLADNTIPWWAIALSVAIRRDLYAHDHLHSRRGLRRRLRLPAGRHRLHARTRRRMAALFLPRYFAGEMLTAYQLIGDAAASVGTLHKVTTLRFFSSRVLPQKACGSSPSPSLSASPSARATFCPSASSLH